MMSLHSEVHVLVVFDIPTNIWEHGMPFDLYDLVLRDLHPFFFSV